MSLSRYKEIIDSARNPSNRSILNSIFGWGYENGRLSPELTEHIRGEREKESQEKGEFLPEDEQSLLEVLHNAKGKACKTVAKKFLMNLGKPLREMTADEYVECFEKSKGKDSSRVSEMLCFAAKKRILNVETIKNFLDENRDDGVWKLARKKLIAEMKGLGGVEKYVQAPLPPALDVEVDAQVQNSDQSKIGSTISAVENLHLEAVPEALGAEKPSVFIESFMPREHGKFYVLKEREAGIQGWEECESHPPSVRARIALIPSEADETKEWLLMRSPEGKGVKWYVCDACDATENEKNETLYGHLERASKNLQETQTLQNLMRTAPPNETQNVPVEMSSLTLKLEFSENRLVRADPFRSLIEIESKGR